MWANKLGGAPGTIRTSDPQIRSLMLYPAELRARVSPSRPANRPGRFRGDRKSRKRPLANGSGPAWQGPENAG
jgi:hypothetical protein